MNLSRVFLGIALLIAVISYLKNIYPNGRIATYFEIIDEPWIPVFMKQYLQDTMFFRWKIVFDSNLVDEKISSKLLELFQTNTQLNRIVAIGSGGGGVEPFILQSFHKTFGFNHTISLTLTDLVPNVREWKAVQSKFPDIDINYIDHSVDATNIPSSLNGVRLCSGMIHHFEPSLVRDILQDSVVKSQPIILIDGKAEFSQFFIGPPRSALLSLTSSIYHLRSTLITPANTPDEEKERRYRLLHLELPRMLLTWSGILPFIQAHDYLASLLRFYGDHDMRAIIQTVPNREDYEWHYHYDLPVLTMLVGVPKSINLTH
jgi:hypothetical protein